MRPTTHILCLRIVAGWTQEDAAKRAEVSLRQWVRWENGENRMQAASWLLMLRRAGLPETWRPPTVLMAWARSMVGHKHDVVALGRALGRTEPAEEPIVVWRRKQAERADVPVERVVLRR